MVGNGGLDGRSAQSLVGYRGDEARISFFFFYYFRFFLMFLIPPKNYMVLVTGAKSQWSIMTKAIFSPHYLCHT